MTTPSPRAFLATDAEVIDWTIQHYRSLQPDTPDSEPWKLTTGEDLELLVAAAADQVREHDDPDRGYAEHLITHAYVWPIRDRQYEDVLITVLTHPIHGVRLATESLNVDTFSDDEHTTTEAVITHALTQVFDHVRQVLEHAYPVTDPAAALNLTPELARRIDNWANAWRDHLTATEAALDRDEEPPDTLDLTLEAEALLLDLDVDLAAARTTSGPSADSSPAA